MKKRKAMITALMTAILMIIGITAAFAADSEAEDHEHYAICTKPNVCAQCGVFDLALQEEHTYEQKQYQSINQYEHALKCDACGANNSSYEPHTYEQKKYDAADLHVLICDVCGAPDGSYESHTSSGSWLHDETGHWYVCDTCGHKFSFAAHAAKCNLPGVCFTCGWGDPSLKGEHDVIIISAGDLQYHSKYCLRCGEYLSEKEPHVNPIYISDDIRYHRLECDVCGSVSTYHRYDVKNPTVCLDCGFRPDLDENHEHTYGKQYYADAENHWGICDTCYLPTSVIPHTWSKVKTTATCTQAGETDYTCKECKQTKKEATAALGHDWHEAQNISPTCVSKGYIMSVCKSCSDTTLEEVTALGHDWYEAERKEPTDADKGYIITACRNCDDTATQEIPTTNNHDWYEAKNVAPTCSENGYILTACRTCEETMIQEIPKLAHRWSTPEIVPATCTEQGSEKKTCTVCGVFTKKLTDPLGHTFLEGSPVCNTCGYTDAAPVLSDKAEQQKVMEEIMASFLEKYPLAQTMHVNLNPGNIPIHLDGMIQFSIPVEDIGWENFRLVQIHEDEVLTNIPYEIIDGKLVFEVDILGYFALIPA